MSLCWVGWFKGSVLFSPPLSLELEWVVRRLYGWGAIELKACRRTVCVGWVCVLGWWGVLVVGGGCEDIVYVSPD